MNLKRSIFLLVVVMLCCDTMKLTRTIYFKYQFKYIISQLACYVTWRIERGTPITLSPPATITFLSGPKLPFQGLCGLSLLNYLQMDMDFLLSFHSLSLLFSVHIHLCDKKEDPSFPLRVKVTDSHLHGRKDFLQVVRTWVIIC